jgi:hypothetical protein
VTEEHATRASQAPQGARSPARGPEPHPTPSKPRQDDSAPREDEPVVMVCLTQCYPCQFNEHPRGPHTWMAEDDAEHAGHPWPLPPEIAAAHPCGCRCAKETPDA